MTKWVYDYISKTQLAKEQISQYSTSLLTLHPSMQLSTMP